MLNLNWMYNYHTSQYFLSFISGNKITLWRFGLLHQINKESLKQLVSQQILKKTPTIQQNCSDNLRTCPQPNIGQYEY